MSLFAVVSLALASPAFAAPPVTNGSYGVYLIPFNHDPNSLASQIVTKVSSGAQIPSGPDGYTLTSGDVKSLILNTWLSSPQNAFVGWYAAGSEAGFKPPDAGSFDTSARGVDTICNQIRNYLQTPNRLGSGVAFYGMTGGSNCQIDGQPTVVITTPDDHTVHIALTAAHNHVQGNITTPDIAFGIGVSHVADPCVAEDFGFEADTDITISAKAMGIGKLSGKIINASRPSACNVAGSIASVAASLLQLFTGTDAFAMAQNFLDGEKVSTDIGLDLSTLTSALAAQGSRLQMTPYPFAYGGAFGYVFLQQDVPTNFSGSLKGSVHIDNSIASTFTSCKVFKLSATTQIAADLPATWDHGKISYPSSHASYGTIAFGTDKPVAGPKDFTCSFTMAGLPLGYDTKFFMTGGPASGTSMAFMVPKEVPLNWSGDTVVAAASTGDFTVSQTRTDVSHTIVGGATTTNAGNSSAVLQQHGVGGDPAQDALVAGRAFALNSHDYISLGALATANAKLGKAVDARAELAQAISLATIAHDGASVVKFQAQLKAIGQ